jgi:hypothetical protein
LKNAARRMAFSSKKHSRSIPMFQETCRERFGCCLANELELDRPFSNSRIVKSAQKVQYEQIQLTTKGNTESVRSAAGKEKPGTSVSTSKPRRYQLRCLHCPSLHTSLSCHAETTGHDGAHFLILLWRRRIKGLYVLIMTSLWNGDK